MSSFLLLYHSTYETFSNDQFIQYRYHVDKKNTPSSEPPNMKFLLYYATSENVIINNNMNLLKDLNLDIEKNKKYNLYR